MKQFVTIVSVVLASFGLASCSDSLPTAPGGVASSTSTPIIPLPSTPGSRLGTAAEGNNFSSSLNNDFVGFAAVANEALIELSELAVNRADLPEVKRFAAQLLQDYRIALNQLRAAAAGSFDGSANASSSSAVPSRVSLDATHQQLITQLARLSGSEFDRVYMTIVVQDLQVAIERYQQNRSSGSSSMHAYTSERLTHLEQDYEMARDLARRVESPLSSIQRQR